MSARGSGEANGVAGRLTSDALTTIYLVRHAQADWRKGERDEDDDRPLSPSGLLAAERVAECLSAQPIAAIYSSPHRRSVETVSPLAMRLGLRVNRVSDLRERHLPVVSADAFHDLVERAWRDPESSIGGGESNRAAQARGLSVVRQVRGDHEGEQVLVATHGNLLALILNALDPAYGYQFWRALSFPDIYRLEFQGARLMSVERIWAP